MGESKELNNAPTPEAIRELAAERDRLRAEVVELRRALDDAQQEVRDKTAIVAQRDLYLEHLEMLWAEKIADMDKNALMDQNAVDLGEFISELERDLTTRGLLDAK